MGERVTYELADGVATIAMDDGKVNALSSAMLGELFEGLDRAESDEAVVVLRGREATFSGGFDLKTFQSGDLDAIREMLAAGARLTERLLSFPQPTVAACNGNAIAMAAFALLCCDQRVGARGEFKIGMNEVMIGLTIPWYAIEVSRHRLAAPWFDRCAVTGALIGPEDARQAGFLDELVAPGEVVGRAGEVATELLAVNRQAHAATKLRVRERVLEGVRAGIERIEGDAAGW